MTFSKLLASVAVLALTSLTAGALFAGDITRRAT